uniref:Uncharacterized protein n=1 Tax=Trachysalambria curvirostris nimavirus TaxID=2984282 RepID=A0A9C7C029_9VIRU|nr:MAG: hypothetical protein [Trachysalambria curvirostris nimavirus]
MRAWSKLTSQINLPLSVGEAFLRRPPSLSMEIDFKSLCPSVKCQDDIGEMIGEALSRQYPGAARTPASEIDKWDASDLLNFEVDPRLINRVYFIDEFDFKLVARQIYKGRALYLHFEAFFYYNYDRYEGLDLDKDNAYFSVRLYVTFDAQILLNSVLDHTHDLEGILRSMVDDGYVDKNSWYFYSRFPHLRRTTSKLLYLCLEAVYIRWGELKEQATAPGILPKTLVKMIEDDTRIRDTFVDYRYYRDYGGDSESNMAKRARANHKSSDVFRPYIKCGIGKSMKLIVGINGDELQVTDLCLASYSLFPDCDFPILETLFRGEEKHINIDISGFGPPEQSLIL